MSNFNQIWEELNNLDEYYFQDRESDYFKDHFTRHGDGMTDEEYDESANLLSSYPAIPIGTGEIRDIYGYIAQNGTKVKFAYLPKHKIILVGYIETGVDEGFAITHYKEGLNQFLNKVNPLRKLNKDEKEDLRYKSDLDGNLKGLSSFAPLPEENIRSLPKEDLDMFIKLLKSKKRLPKNYI